MLLCYLKEGDIYVLYSYILINECLPRYFYEKLLQTRRGSIFTNIRVSNVIAISNLQVDHEHHDLFYIRFNSENPETENSSITLFSFSMSYCRLLFIHSTSILSAMLMLQRDVHTTIIYIYITKKIVVNLFIH